MSCTDHREVSGCGAPPCPPHVPPPPSVGPRVDGGTSCAGPASLFPFQVRRRAPRWYSSTSTPRGGVHTCTPLWPAIAMRRQQKCARYCGCTIDSIIHQPVQLRTLTCSNIQPVLRTPPATNIAAWCQLYFDVFYCNIKNI